MIRCPHCLKANENSSAFCSNCGRKFPFATRFNPLWVILPVAGIIVFAVAGVIILTGLGVIRPDFNSDISKSDPPQTSPGPKATPPAKSPEPTKSSINEEEKIKAIVAIVLSGKTNSENERSRNIDVVKQMDGGWGVFVQFNADENFTNNLTKKGIEMKMSDIYIALYNSNLDIRRASAAGYLHAADKYGNTGDKMVYKSMLDKEIAKKVNWNADKATLELEILPGLWTTTILDSSLNN